MCQACDHFRNFTVTLKPMFLKAGDSPHICKALTCLLFDISHNNYVGAQGDRYSIAYFANAQASTKLQGPQPKYPPITFPDILAAKQKHKKTFAKPQDSTVTDEDYIAFQASTAIGPEFDDPGTVAALRSEV